MGIIEGITQGTAGDPDPDVVTVQGISGGVPTAIDLTHVGGTVQSSGVDLVDPTYSAWKVNVVAGGAGGGLSQLQIRNASNVWTDVGHYVGNLSLPVTSIDLDIRDLNSATDSVSITDGNGSITVDGSVTVSATDLDIRDLSHTQDSIKIGDGIDLLAVNADGSINTIANIGTTGGLLLDNTFTSRINTLGQKIMDTSTPVVLASDQSAIRVTLSTNPDAAQGLLFRAVITNYNLGTAGVKAPILLVRNPVGSGKSMYLRRWVMSNRVKTQSYIMELYHSPTITTNGTTRTAVNTKIGDSTTSILNLYTGSTISSFGTILGISSTGTNQNDNERAALVDILPPGYDYVFSGEGSNNNTAIDLLVEWTEG